MKICIDHSDPCG